MMFEELVSRINDTCNNNGVLFRYQYDAKDNIYIFEFNKGKEAMRYKINTFELSALNQQYFVGEIERYIHEYFD